MVADFERPPFSKFLDPPQQLIKYSLYSFNIHLYSFSTEIIFEIHDPY